MNRDGSDRQSWIASLKTIFDFLVIGIMVWAVLVAMAANRLTHEALNSTHTPWLKVTGVGVDDRSNIKYTLKNFSDTPALRLQVETSISGISGSPTTYTHDALMPSDSGDFSFRYTGERARELSKEINEGKIPIVFLMRYQNIFGQTFVIEQEVCWVEDMFRDVRYEMKQPRLSE